VISVKNKEANMARAKKGEVVQLDMFSEAPTIRNFGITAFKLSGMSLEVTAAAAVNVPDVAMLDKSLWKRAAADWLLRLCDGNSYDAQIVLSAAEDEALKAAEKNLSGLEAGPGFYAQA
jgi:hypothetical protein